MYQHFNRRKLRSGILLLLVLFSLDSQAQRLLNSRTSSSYTYIYKVSSAEAKQIYSKKDVELDPMLLHTLVDSFLTDEEYTQTLPQGHYLTTYADRGMQRASLETVSNFKPYVYNNNTDLCVQLLDSKGEIIADAQVKVGRKKLHFNEKAQLYIDKKSNRDGLLEVNYRGFTAYYELMKNHKNSWAKRNANAFLYRTPVKYLARPIRYLVYLPIDGVKSIEQGYAQGTINRTKHFAINSYEKVACWFDDYHCNNYSQKAKGYLVFNKPKYQPGDTVKFKAFMTNKKGRPINKKMQVKLYESGEWKEISTLKPYRKGAYSDAFLLHDSLKLKLNNYYTMELTSGKRTYLKRSFIYEDYELKGNKLDWRLESEEHFRGKGAKIYVRASDENNLNLMDARVEVTLTPQRVKEYHQNQVFVPNVLLRLEQKLEPTGETEIVLSDSLFPQANLKYQVNLRLLNSDNEALAKRKIMTYYHQVRRFNAEVQTDSIRFSYTENKEVKMKKAQIYGIDNFNKETLVYEGSTPCILKIEPYYSSYIIRSGKQSKRVNMLDEASKVRLLSNRTNDSLQLVVNNPRKLPFAYHIYKKNKLQDYGYADSLRWEKKTNSKQPYLVSLRYLWGGSVKEENYPLLLQERKLQLQITQPRLVYPGQQTKVDIVVTDNQGKPVEGVDLTAYGLTQKFKSDAPLLPRFEKNRGGKKYINNFSLGKLDGMQMKTSLDYDTWRILAGLDTIAYYNFIYPQSEIYRFSYELEDKLTQFAPFVLSKGKILPIHVIYVDNKPVYFSWSSNERPYSFAISPGYHQVELRTTQNTIVIDSLHIEAKKKLIFSLDKDSESEQFTIKDAPHELTKEEKEVLYPYIAPYRHIYKKEGSYIRQWDGQFNFYQLHDAKGAHQGRWLGPVSGELNYRQIKEDSPSTSMRFRHEPFFEYEFQDKLLKMREANTKNYPRELFRYGVRSSLGDSIWSTNSLEKSWRNYLSKEKAQQRQRKELYHYPKASAVGEGDLLIDLQQKTKEENFCLNTLLFKYDEANFIRLYPGKETNMCGLKPGYYRLVFFYAGAKYHMEDSLLVKADGQNYHAITQPKVMQKDSFSMRVSEIIEKHLDDNKKYQGDNKSGDRQLSDIYRSYHQQFKYEGSGREVAGYVYDADSKDGIAGVTVQVKGTNYGTFTNNEGYYSMTIPSGFQTLQFSFVGCDQQEHVAPSSGRLNVELSVSKEKLDEVVIVGHKVERKVKNCSASVVTIETGAPLVSYRLQGIVPGIQVRGVSSVDNDDASPLIIINGEVYTGDMGDLDMETMSNISVLKDTESKSIYGARGAHGVILMATKDGLTPSQKGANFDAEFLAQVAQANSIRNNFSDYAFWQPRLTTDKQGKASFKTTFPDDVTAWDTHFLAMSDKKQSGQWSGRIKSYKPLMAQLAAPRFAVKNDTINVIGKLLNYTNNSVRAQVSFAKNGEELLHADHQVEHAAIDTVLVSATTDTLHLKYSMKMHDGYFDGEQRKVPIYPVGMETVKGNFHTLDKDTTITLPYDESLGELHLYASADAADVLEKEIDRLINYKYKCTEQLASKLKAYLARQQIAVARQKEFTCQKEVEQLIAQIQKRQQDSGLWGWWEKSPAELWISIHVLEALLHAEQMDYPVSFRRDVAKAQVLKLEQKTDFSESLQRLKFLRLLHASVDYPHYIAQLENQSDSTLGSLLGLLELKQMCDMPYQLDTLNSYRQTKLLGQQYFADQKKHSLLRNEVQYTLAVYRLLRNDSTVVDKKLAEMRSFLLNKRRNGHWLNTYESARIIETILPDLLGERKELTPAKLVLQGGVEKTVGKFPFEMKLRPKQSIKLSKSGDSPLYFTSYQRYWDSSPSVQKKDFEITSRIEGKPDWVLKAGEEVKLCVEVTASGDAEYVLINIPIPASCSYADKKINYWGGNHREYFKNETAIFCRNLKAGTYIFEVDLVARYTGIYTLNPAKVEQMYFPTFNANTELKRVKVE
ncbi:MAG: alpha-2-macroglobulin family protein [Bacteroidales bacterium]